MFLKRVNFNMAPEFHTLLKGVCALKNITVSDYVYGLIAADFEQLLSEDKAIRDLFLSSDYSEGSRAQKLKRKFMNEQLSECS